jgi:hypothetical protein
VGDLATQALGDVEALRESLANIKVELERLPFFLRSFVEKELSQSTDFTIAEWASVFDDLARRLAAVAEGAHRLADGTAADTAWQDVARTADFPTVVDSLVGLQGFMQRVPGKMAMVPALVMGQQERAEFLANVQEQSAHLGGLVDALPRLAAEASRLAASS